MIPAAVNEKLRRLEQSAADSEALMRLRTASLDQTQRSDLVNARNKLNTTDPADAKTRAAAQAAVDAVEQRIAEIEADIAKHAARYRTDAQVLAQLRDYLQRLPPNRVLQPVEIKVRANRMNAGMVLEKCRERIADLSSELNAVQRAPLARSDIETAIKQHVAELATHGRPAIDVAGGLRITWPSRATTVQTLAWLDPGALVERMVRDLPPSIGKDKGMSEAERIEQTKTLRSELLAAEREEEALIEIAITAGIDVVRRPMADPRAILSVEVTKAPARAAA